MSTPLRHLLLPLLLVGSPNANAADEIGSAAVMKVATAEKPPLLETIEALVSIDSGTGYQAGLSRIEKILVDRLQELGASVELHPAAASVVGNNIVARLTGRGSSRILLMIHYDTVFEEGEAQRRPFRIENGRLYGPGVADAKGSIALILHALKMLRDMKFDGYGTLTVLFNPDEEKGSFGSRDLIRQLAAQQDYVLSFEPPETDDVTVATNGINYLFLKTTGVASHAGSAPEQGRNAITELAHQLLQLNDLGDPEKGTTVNWTIVKGGTRRNIIPAEADAEGDMRYSDYGEIDRVTADVERISRNRLIPDTGVEFRIERGRPPLPRNNASEQLAAVAQKVYEATGRKLGTRMMRFGTDAGYAYRPGAEQPAVLETLGLVGGGLHSPDEYAELDSIVPRLFLTVGMVMKLSGR